MKTNADQVTTSQANSTLSDLSGLIERVTYHNEESGFCVLRVKARGHRDLITVVGTMPEVRAGEWIEAQGRWIIERDYGQQFRAEILPYHGAQYPGGHGKIPGIRFDQRDWAGLRRQTGKAFWPAGSRYD